MLDQPYFSEINNTGHDVYFFYVGGFKKKNVLIICVCIYEKYFSVIFISLNFFL